MGQCISRRSLGPYSNSQSFARTVSESGDEAVLVRSNSPSDEKQTQKKPNNLTKGVAMSFGFRKKPSSNTYQGNPAAARRLAANDSTVDKNGNDDSSSIPPSGRSTPKLVPPRKEPHSTRVSRFGFRQPNQNRLNKIGDIKPNFPPNQTQYNNKIENNNLDLVIKPKVTFHVENNNKNESNCKSKPSLKVNKQPTKFTLQSSSLPRPQFPVRVVETKAVKTMINTTAKKNQKEKSTFEEDVKDEDSGVSSQENDSKSPTTSEEVVRKQRTLEVVLKDHTFDVRDVGNVRNVGNIGNIGNIENIENLDDSIERDLELPKLKTSFDSINNLGNNLVNNSVKKRAQEYERKLEKTFSPIGRFLKTGINPDSDQWLSGESISAGEAMADCTLSSSEEVRTKIAETITFRLSKDHTFFEDPKFTILANNSTKLLQNETSPTDILLSFSESDEFKCKDRLSSSKDVCSEKSNPPSPGTPTNISDSLSLSDGKDFLIDDEIADQPALVFDDNKGASENDTLIESTPKIKRKDLRHSFLKNLEKKKFLSRSDSVETLSTCESIASDDLMLDYDHHETISENRSEVKTGGLLLDKCEGRDWPLIMGQLDRQIGKHTDRSASRLLRSRGGTPDSSRSSRSIETRSGNGSRARSAVAESPLRFQTQRMAIEDSPTNYESDDSIKVDRSSHNAMVQEVLGMKTMLLKLKRVLQESEMQNPFEIQRNGLFPDQQQQQLEDPPNYKLELEDLKRQVLFLQGQVEDREKVVKQLQELVTQNYASNSAPASTVCVETSNAATQTERIRPISAGPSLLNSSQDSSVVSSSEGKRSPRYIKPPAKSQKPPPNKPSSRNSPSSPTLIPVRSASRSRRPLTPS